MANVKAPAPAAGLDDATAGAAATTSTNATGDKIVKASSTAAAAAAGFVVPNAAVSEPVSNATLTTATTAGNYLGQKLKAAQVEGLGAGNDLHTDVR